MGFDVDWTHGAEHMGTGHRVSVTEANEALADADAQLFDPDPKSTSGASARVLGYFGCLGGCARGHPRAPRRQARRVVGRERVS